MAQLFSNGQSLEGMEGYGPQLPPKSMFEWPTQVLEEMPLGQQPEPREEKRAKFRRLTAQWRAEVRFISSYTERVMHPAYQTIIGMGPDVVPLIIEELHVNGGHWFWALRAITEEDPVPEEDEGKIKKMRDAWLAWACRRGII